MEIFNFFPQIIIVIAVAFIVILLAWKFPKTKEKQRIEKRAEAIAHKATESKSKVSDIKMTKKHIQQSGKMKVEELVGDRPKRKTRRIKDLPEETVEINVEKKDSPQKDVLPKGESLKEPKKDDVLDLKESTSTDNSNVHTERKKALEDKKEMHQNVLMVIDRVAYLAKRGGVLVKTGTVTSIAFIRKQQASFKKRKMTPQQVDQEKLLDALEKAALALGASQFGKAEAKYIDVIKIDSKNVRAYKGLAEIYEKQGNLDHALASMEQVIKLDPLDPDSEKRMLELRSKRAQKKMKEKSGKTKKAQK